jgi:hypothetical protein
MSKSNSVRSDHPLFAKYPLDGAVVIRHERYAELAFRPDFVQHSAGIRFVYLRPQPFGATLETSAKP